MPESIFTLLIATFVALGVGLALGFVLGRRLAHPDTRIENELRSQLAAQEAELANVRQAQRQAEGTQAAAEAAVRIGAERLTETRQQHEELLVQLRTEHERGLAQMREAFSTLGTEALAKLQPQFLDHAAKVIETQQERAKGDLTQRQEAIATLLKPLEEMLRTYQSRLAQSETVQSTAIGEVRQQLEQLAAQSSSLSGETLQLRRILSNNQARGRWGEETLRRVVEASGMSVHCDFVEQEHGDDRKPDLVVKLPGDRLIIVDSKVPDLDFLNALNTAEETKRSELLKQHAAKLRATVKALADRDYPSQFPNSLDHVVLFLPAESLFSAALEGDNDLIVAAAEKRIMLATPTSLIALLRAVSASWQQHEQSENARDIADAAQELFTRVAAFTKHLDNIRSGLAKANDAFNEAVGSYDRSVRPSGERMLKLGVASGGKELAELTSAATVLREVPGR
jgi:DNA recombination protein RmuC